MHARSGLFKRRLRALLEKGNGGMQVMSAMEKLEFQEFFLQKLTVAAQLRVIQVHVFSFFPFTNHTLISPDRLTQRISALYISIRIYITFCTGVLFPLGNRYNYFKELSSWNYSNFLVSSDTEKSEIDWVIITINLKHKRLWKKLIFSWYRSIGFIHINFIHAIIFV